jgi:hypothetical protein
MVALGEEEWHQLTLMQKNECLDGKETGNEKWACVYFD